MNSVIASSLKKVVALGLLISALSLSLVGGVGAQEASGDNNSSESTGGPLASDILADAAEVASMYGISVDEARTRLERQPRIGQLEQALGDNGPASFGGLFIDQVPEYRVIVLSRPDQSAQVGQAIDDLGFSDLKPFVVVRETPYTIDVLEAALQRVGQVAGAKATTLGLDIQTGEVLATAATSADVDAVRAAVASATPPVQARRVVVTIGAGVIPVHSYGGLVLSECTSGFSVRRTTDNVEGVTTAGHCADSLTLVKHDAALDFVTQKYADSQDAQWHKTPGLNDVNLINDRDGNGIDRTITSRTDRSEMSVGGNVCHSGKTTGYGCGEIAEKSYDIDGGGSTFNATWIRVKNDRVDLGDSGGPWFLANSAYGTTHGYTNNTAQHPVFMAQNYLGAFNVVVKIN